MNTAVRKQDLSVVAPVKAEPPQATVLSLPERKDKRSFSFKPLLDKLVKVVLPPLAVLALFLLIWQVLASRAGLH
jgi:hypothetical protein